MGRTPITLLPHGVISFETSINSDGSGLECGKVEGQHSPAIYRGRRGGSSPRNITTYARYKRSTHALAINSVSLKKKRASRSAFSSESEAWIAFRSLDSA